MSISPITSQGLRGHYGFLTDYSPMSPEDIHQRIERLFALGVKEVQFYDWFYSYSLPVPRDENQMWKEPYFKNRNVSLVTIKQYIREIRDRNGRSWAYVQLVGAKEDFLDRLYPGVKKLIQGNGKEYVHKEGILHCYFPNRPWAERMVEVWALSIKELGFDGIHWDTLSAKAGDYNAETEGIHEFLRYSFEKLQQLGLRQTANFVDLNWWDDTILRDYVEFPYVEVWSDVKKNNYYQNVERLFSNHPRRGLQGVVAYYPKAAGKSIPVLFEEALHHRCSYLIFRDGEKRLVNEYFPGAIDAIAEEKNLILWQIFKRTLGGAKIALRTGDEQHFLSAENGGGEAVHARYTEKHAWQTFNVTFYEPRTISLRSHNGHYLTAEGVGGPEVHARYSEDHSWQKFEVHFYTFEQIALRTLNGTFLSATNGGGSEITTQPKMERWERFTYFPNDNNHSSR